MPENAEVYCVNRILQQWWMTYNEMPNAVVRSTHRDGITGILIIFEFYP